VIDDNARVRQAIEVVLAGDAVTCAATAARGLELLDEVEPDLLLVDLTLPDMDGVDLLVVLRKARPNTPALVITVDDSEERILAALRAGARGYILKDELGRRLVGAIDDVLGGGAPLSPAAARHVVEALRGATSASAAGGLTAREREVLAELATDTTYEDIADALDVSVNTVRAHVRAVYDKLGVSSRAAAVVEGMSRGLIRR
jgi:DNA-binding NarL/FixJ family response regulator